MITKRDCILLLTDLEENGIDIGYALEVATSSADIDIDVLKFINENRQIDLSAFYEKIRKSYNDKHSNLYINIVRGTKEPGDVLTTLSAMLTQILLFAKNANDREMFLRHSRASEISQVLSAYFKTYDLSACMKLISLIKADILALEYIAGRREEE